MLLTASHVPNSASYFLDGTDGWVVGKEVWDTTDVDQEVNVLTRPPGDSGFEALRQVDVTDNDRVVSFHDDDNWSGIPNPQGDAAPALLYPCIPVFDGASPPRHSGLLSTQHVLFGSIRGDIFNSYVNFVNSHPRPSGALDWPLRSVVLASGVARPFQNYQYDYDIGHWADAASTSNANESVLGQAGWHFSDSHALSRLVVMLDSIALQAFHAQRTGQRFRASAVTQELLGPPFRGPRMRRLMRLAPFRSDVLEPMVRRGARSRIRHVYLSSQFAKVDSQVHPSLFAFIVNRSGLSLQDLREVLLPCWTREFPEEVRPQLRFWDYWVNRAISLKADRSD